MTGLPNPTAEKFLVARTPSPVSGAVLRRVSKDFGSSANRVVERPLPLCPAR